MKKSILTMAFLVMSCSAMAGTFSDGLNNVLSIAPPNTEQNSEYIKFTGYLYDGVRSSQLPMFHQRIGYQSTQTEVFTRDFEKRVKEYQAEHGLEPSGIIGPSTVWMLNFDNNIAARNINYTKQAIVDFNISSRPNKYIVVNIPEYKLYVVENDDIVFESNVIVGKSGTKSGGATPLMETNVVGITYNPPWNPTPNITNKKLLPKYAKHPDYLEHKGIKVLDASGKVVTDRFTISEFRQRGYRLYQPAGEKSSLGMIKFVLDNNQNIYLHDTNDRGLFGKVQRDFSSGCVRVERWEELASIVSGQPVEQIQKKINTKRTFGESVEKLPVYIVYWTVTGWNDKVKYNVDVYGKVK